MTTCSKCGQIKPATTEHFYKKGGVRSGLTAQCKQCLLREQSESYRRNPEPKKASAARRRQMPGMKGKLKEYFKQHYAANRERALAQESAKYKENAAHRERKRQASLKWARDNPKWAYAHQRQRKMERIRAMPAWADKEALNKIYIERPEGMDVDHIIPIRNKLVCGLHVPWNLQYLTRTANRQKRNKFQPEHWSREPD